MNNNFSRFLFLFIAALFLMLSAFQNGYPLIFVGDTGGYLKYAFMRDHTHDGSSHSFLYGLFILISSFGSSLFYVAFIQCLVTAYIILKTVELFSKDETKVNFQFLVITVFLSFFTSITKYSGKIMPDIFTGILVLTTVHLLYNNSLKRYSKIIFSIIFVLAIAFHTSHLIILGFSLFVYIIYLLIFNRAFFLQLRPKLYLLFGLIVSQIVLVMAIHFGFTKEIYYSKGKHIFLMGRLSETGILNDFLNNTNCVYRICKYKDVHHDFNTFVWNLEKAVTYQEYGKTSFEAAWKASEKDYNGLIRDILATPKYFYRFTITAVSTSFSLLFNPFEPNEVNWHDGWTDDKINSFLKDDVYSYRNSLQSLGKFLEIDKRIGFYQAFSTPLSLIVILLLLAKKISLNIYIQNFLILITIFFISNAFICGTFSGLYSRYQERILWLIPFIALLLLFNWKSKTHYL